MAQKRIVMTGAEFVQKLAGGEKDLAHVWLPPGTRLQDEDGYNHLKPAENVNLSGAHLVGVKAGKLELPGVYAAGTVLYGAYLSNGIFTQGRFSGADLRKANLFAVDAQGANFNNARLSGAKLAVADLRRAYIPQADFAGVNLTGTDLKGATLYEADVTAATLKYTDLRGSRGFCTARNLPDARIDHAVVTAGGLRLLRYYARQALGPEFTFPDSAFVVAPMSAEHPLAPE